MSKKTSSLPTRQTTAKCRQSSFRVPSEFRQSSDRVPTTFDRVSTEFRQSSDRVPTKLLEISSQEKETDLLAFPLPINLDALEIFLALATTAAEADFPPLGDGLTNNSESPLLRLPVPSVPRASFGEAHGEEHRGFPPPNLGEANPPPPPENRGIFLQGEGELPVDCCSSSSCLASIWLRNLSALSSRFSCAFVLLT